MLVISILSFAAQLLALVLIPPIIFIFTTVSALFHSYRNIGDDTLNLFFYSIPNLYDEFVLSRKVRIIIFGAQQRDGIDDDDENIPREPIWYSS